MYDLGAQFRPNQNLLMANSRCIIRGKTYRITILSEHLIRLEYNTEGNFYDGATELVSCRAFNQAIFNIQQDERYVLVSTEFFKLEYYKEQPFNKGLKVTITSSVSGNQTVWSTDNQQVTNYKGLFGSYDVDNKVDLGLYSLDGFVCLDDSNTNMINPDGTISPRNGYYDAYLFTYGRDFNKCLEDYFILTGKPSFVPRYALGNWWCRNTNYTSEDILKTAINFDKYRIPFSIMLLDKDWHKRELATNEGTKFLFTGYSFNRLLIPEPEKIISELHEKNIRVGLSINPKEGLYPLEDHYEDAARYLGTTPGSPINLDFNDPKNVDVYLKCFVHPLEAQGVDFFWNDYDKEGDRSTLWKLNHYHFMDMERDKAKRGLILGRYGGVCPHRYPVVYTGKTEVSWDMLNKIPQVNMQAANIGVSFVSTDISGNHGGIEESELYIRSVELGVFSPIVRFHGARGKYYKKEPWLWDPKTLYITQKYLSLRHKLLPYLYTESYKYYDRGICLVRPLYYDLGWVYDDPNFRNEYYFGSQLLISPIISKKDQIMDRTIHKFYIPEGTWYDFFNGKTFNGNKKYTSFFREDDYPVFVKAGAIIPLSNKSNQNNVGNPINLEFKIFPGASSSYMLYEDDGVTSLYKEGFFLKTGIEFNYDKSNYTVIVKSLEGKKGIVPDTRNYRFRFVNTKLADQIVAMFNNSKVDCEVYLEDNDLVVEVFDIPTVGNFVLSVKGKDIEISSIRLVNDEIDSIIMGLQINTFVKERISSIMFSDIPIKNKRIEIRKLKKSGLSKEYISLFIKLLEYVENI